MWQYNNTPELYHWGIPGMKWKKKKKYDPSDPANLRKALNNADAKVQVKMHWKDGPTGYSKNLTQRGKGYIDKHGKYFEGTLAQATKKKWEYDKSVAQKNAEKAVAEYNKKHPVKHFNDEVVSSGKKLVDKLLSSFK